MKTAYFTCTDDNSVFRDSLNKLIDKFKYLNGEELKVIRNVPNYNCNCSISIQFPWFKTFLWDLVDDSVERVVFLDRFSFPLKPIYNLPESCFAIVPFLDSVKNNLFPSFSIHARFKHCNPLYDVTFFSATRELKSIFELMKAKRFSPKESTEEKGYINSVLKDSGAIINQLDLKYNWLPINGETPEDAIQIQYKQGMKMSSKDFLAAWA